MEKIAIIGMSCLFPDAQTPEQFWQNLVDRKHSVSAVTGKQMSVESAIFYDPEMGKKDRYYCTKGGYIQNFAFNPNGYRLPGEFLESLDDIFKWSIYVCSSALEDSNYLNNKSVLEKCGVILGNLSIPTKFSQRIVSPIYRQAVNSAVSELLEQPNFELGKLKSAEGISLLNMASAAYPTTVVARSLSLGSIHFSLDAACSSVLYTIELATHYLRSRKSDLMLAGAVCCADPFMKNMVFSLLRAYPEDSISNPLDKSSEGLLTGEGAGALVLKRYRDAVRDGDKIYATIGGIGLSNDGRGKYFVSPNPKGQILAFERAYQQGGIDPKSIAYIECHATGTPLGDQTEVASMDSFFGKYGAAPYIGSVKSNLSHLLTAAGMPSTIKAILSMSFGSIPPTIRIKDPLRSDNGVINSDSVVRSAIDLPNRGSCKRTAVSAFGFGGTNAHMILEQETGEGKEEEQTPSKMEPMAIIGMDAIFGSCNGLDAFERTIYQGKQHFIDLPRDRWKGIENEKELLAEYGFTEGIAPKGAYIKDFELDFLKFKIPPKPIEQPITQQLLMLQVADRAVKDAGLQPGGNVAVIVAMETELTIHRYRARCDSEWQLKQGLNKIGISLSPEKLSELENLLKGSLEFAPEVNRTISYIGNIIACRISSLWDFLGPSFTLSAQENSVFKALEVAELLLSEEQVDAVVVGAIDLAGGVENVLLRNKINKVNTGKPSLSFDRDANGWLVGEGAGAVVLKRLDIAKENGDRIYATIDAISLVQGDRDSQTDKDALSRSCQEALEKAGISSKDIGYLEVFASGIEKEDEREIEGLIDAYSTSTELLSCAIGSVKANIGHTFAASGMASLIKTALCLYYGYIPGNPQWSGSKSPEIWQDSPFYVPTFSRLWSVAKDVPKRFAAINGLGLDRTYAHIILSEELKQERHSNYLEKTPFYLFPIGGRDRDAILEQLNSLEEAIEGCSSLEKCAFSTFAAFSSSPNPNYSLAILGANKDELSKEIERARRGVKSAFEKQGEWRTPLGSYFTAKPLGKQGKVAFVYPGSFNTYLGMGIDLYRLFPKIHDVIDRYSAGKTVKELIDLSNATYYPRSFEKPSQQQREILQQKALENASIMLVSGIITAIVNTTIVRDYFRVKPQAAFGDSLGELSMMFALNIWGSPERIARNLQTSSMFTSVVSGAMNAVRMRWGLPLSNQPADKDFWSSYVVLASIEAVNKILDREERVYLIHVNTPTEVVIAGDKRNCLRVIKQLECNYFPAPSTHVLHCEVVESEYNEFVKWFSLPIENVPPIDIYSGGAGGLATIEQQAIADSIATVMCNPIDFPRLVNQVYEDGARIFVELGGGGIASRWIRENLQQKDHMAVPFSIRGIEDHKAIVRLLAQLLSHGVDLDLSPLYVKPETTPTQQKSLVKTVTLGGKRIRETILTEENRRKFANCVQKIEKSAIDPTSISHSAFLRERQEELREISQIVKQQISISQKSLEPQSQAKKTEESGLRFIPQTNEVANKKVIFDEADLLEFAGGSVGNVFDREYRVIDSYPKRTRLPLPPYLFVSRVTELEAERGCYHPAAIVTEYDIPEDAWYAVNGQIPCAVILEASHGHIFLMSYLGIDFEAKGERSFRALGGKIVFLDDLPLPGDTMRCEIRVTSSAKSNDTTIYFITCDYFVGERYFLELKLGVGLFSEEQLKGAKGISLTKIEKEKRQKIQKQYFEPLRSCHKSSFEFQDLVHLSSKKPNLAACFGEQYDRIGKNPYLGLPTLPILMLDRVISVDPRGGAWGLGLLVAEKTLNPEHWYFNCHFKGDFCLPGALMNEGCIQLIQFYILYLGLNTLTNNARFKPIINLPQTGQYRGQIKRSATKLSYELEVTEIGLNPSPFVKAEGKVIFEGKTICTMKNIGVQLSENS